MLPILSFPVLYLARKLSLHIRATSAFLSLSNWHEQSTPFAITTVQECVLARLQIVFSYEQNVHHQSRIPYQKYPIVGLGTSTEISHYVGVGTVHALWPVNRMLQLVGVQPFL